MLSRTVSLIISLSFSSCSYLPFILTNILTNIPEYTLILEILQFIQHMEG